MILIKNSDTITQQTRFIVSKERWEFHEQTNFVIAIVAFGCFSSFYPMDEIRIYKFIIQLKYPNSPSNEHITRSTENNKIDNFIVKSQNKALLKDWRWKDRNTRRSKSHAHEKMKVIKY